MLLAAISTTSILLIVLLILAIGAVPYGNSRGWGPWAGGPLGLLLVVVVVLFLMGRLHI